MHVRQAQPSDVAAIVSIAYDAFLHEPIYMQFSPHHFTYPDDFRAFLDQEIKLRMASPGQVVMVAEVDDSDASILKEGDGDVQGAKSIAGYACWVHHRGTDIISHWSPDSLNKRIERGLLTLRSYYMDMFSLDRTTSHATIREFHTSASAVISGMNIENLLELNTLAVSPHFQRRGIGGILIDWGLEQARGNAVTIFLEATKGGLGLYKRKRFSEVTVLTLPARTVERMGNAAAVEVEETTMTLMVWKDW